MNTEHQSASPAYSATSFPRPGHAPQRLANALRVLLALDTAEPNTSVLRGLTRRDEFGPVEAVLLSHTPPTNWSSVLSESGLKPDQLIQSDLSAASILSAAREKRASFILLDLNRKEDAQFISIMKHLLKKSDLPLMVIPPPQTLSKSIVEGVFSHVLFATDWTPVSDRALDFVLNFQCRIETINIVNVVNEKFTPKMLKEFKQRIDTKRKSITDTRCANTEFHIYYGQTWEEILKSADDYHATLIVMGANQKLGIKELFRKRVSLGVARESRVPVLIIPGGRKN